MAKGLSFARGESLLVPCTIKNLGHICRVGSSLSGEVSISKARFL
jgi:hypothetical protein